MNFFTIFCIFLTDLYKFGILLLTFAEVILIKQRKIMNTLVAVAIAPCGVGDELSAEVAEVVRVIRASGLKNRTYSMFTEIEGEWDEVMKVVKEATFVLADKGIRTEVMLKADIRPGFTNMMDSKPKKVEDILSK